MSTADSRSSRPRSNTRVLVRAAMLACAVGLALAGLGGLLSGSSAAYGALFGAGVTALVLFGGSAIVDLVAGILPSASLLVAMLTYTLQLVLLGVVLLAVERSPGLQEALARVWIGSGVIAITATWVVAQIALTTRQRIPAFEPVEGGLS